MASTRPLPVALTACPADIQRHKRAALAPDQPLFCRPAGKLHKEEALRLRVELRPPPGSDGDFHRGGAEDVECSARSRAKPQPADCDVLHRPTYRFAVATAQRLTCRRSRRWEGARDDIVPFLLARLPSCGALPGVEGQCSAAGLPLIGVCTKVFRKRAHETAPEQNVIVDNRIFWVPFFGRTRNQ